MKRNISFVKISFSILPKFTLICLTFIYSVVVAQPKVMSWGNIEGIRVDGQLMEFKSSLMVVSEDWSNAIESYKERQRPQYKKMDGKHVIESSLGNLTFKEIVEDKGKGAIKVDIEFWSKADTAIAGAFFKIVLPVDHYLGGYVVVEDQKTQLTPEAFDVENNFRAFTGKDVLFDSRKRKLQLKFEKEITFYVSVGEYQNQKYVVASVPVIDGHAKKSQKESLSFEMIALGEIDRNPVSLTIDPSNPGRPFDGIGGNFRLQNPEVDPQVIQYCLDSLNVTWARVELPWRFWHPDENIDPLEEARNGRIHERVEAAMKMAKKVYDMGIPVILADWSAPDWAVEGENYSRPRPNGQWGNPLDQTKKNKIYESLTGYLVFLKEKYGVEVEMFSFNESDLGIYVRQTDEEHTRLIKELGAYFKSKGLKTKMLLGDTADANGYEFINHAMSDPGVKPFVGAVSFHSWRGWEDETLGKWGDAATRMEIPLIVGEGSIDASAWRVPAIFEDANYALMEIDLYVRILNICQPKSILQWQLTADYSILSGGGVFGNHSEGLHPTQRFWNLKQLSLTPEGLHSFPVDAKAKDLSYAALGDRGSGKYAIHLVNNGASREVTINGLPENAKSFQVYMTRENRDMKSGEVVNVEDGQLTFKAEQASFISLIQD